MKPGARGAAAGALRLVSAFPLHLAAALLAALVCDLLLTVQPMFLRAFIDQAQAGTKGLWAIPRLMLAAAALAYVFDFISVAIRFLLERGLSWRLTRAYLEFGSMSRAETAQFALRRGIPSLSRLALGLTLELILALIRVLLILVCMGLEQAALGAVSAAVLVLSLAASGWATGRIGRVSRTMEVVMERLQAAAVSGRGPALGLLSRFYRFDRTQFGLRSVNVFLSTILFRVLPVGALGLYLTGAGLSLGALASVFLYFSMLRGPYSDLVALLQDSLVSWQESSLFSEDLEGALEAQALAERVPVGLVCDARGLRRGRALSRAGEEPRAREYFDDMADPGPKSERLAALARESRRASIRLHSTDPAAERAAHFRLSADGRLSVAPA